MQTINLDEVRTIGLDQTFMANEFDPDKLTTIEEEGVTVTYNGEKLPGHYRMMKTETEYIFRILPQGFDDGFNIYRVRRDYSIYQND